MGKRNVAYVRILSLDPSKWDTDTGEIWYEAVRSPCSLQRIREDRTRASAIFRETLDT